MEDAEIERKLAAGSAYADLPGRHVSISQLVAYNLMRFRKAAGLTQEELGQQLGGWSPASVSAAERSWDGKRIRKFDADEIVNIAMTLNIPVPALFLPPEDDGVNVRYLFDLPGEDGPASSCHAMRDLFQYLMSEPGEDDTPAMRAYRERYIASLSVYLDPGRGAELAEYLEDLSTEERLVERLARLRSQYDAIRGVLADIDQLQEALTGRLFKLRGGLHTDKRTPERREWDERINEIIKEMFGTTGITRTQMDQAIAEARRRGIDPPPRDRWFLPGSGGES